MGAEINQSPRASFLGIPPELRCRIYEFALGIEPISDLCRLSLKGSAESDGLRTKSQHAISSLPLVCKLVYSEVSHLQPVISNIDFIFQDFTFDNMREWLDQMGDRLSHIRKWEIKGWGLCGESEHERHLHESMFSQGEGCGGYHGIGNCHPDCIAYEPNPTCRMEQRGFCHRSFTIDLTRVERNLAMQFGSVLAAYCNPQSPLDFWHKVQDQLCETTFDKGLNCGWYGIDSLEGAIERLVCVDHRSKVNKSNFYDVFEAVMADRPYVSDSEDVDSDTETETEDEDSDMSDG